MTVELNHTIVHVTDKNRAAEELAEVLGVDPPTTYGPFRVLTLANGVSLDFADDHGAPDHQHYAFLVGESEFDAIRERIVERRLTYWADPFHRRRDGSTPRMAGVACTGRAPTATTSRSSPSPTAAEPGRQQRATAARNWWSLGDSKPLTPCLQTAQEAGG